MEHQGPHKLGEWVREVLARERPDFIVEDFIRPQALTLVSGEAKLAHKSWTILTWALLIAAGKSAWGFNVRQRSRVWVIEQEGADVPLAMRLKSLAQSLGIDLDELDEEGWFFVEHMSGRCLDNPHDVSYFEKYMLKHNIDVVFVDTLAASLTNADENRAQDIGRLLKGLTRLRSHGAAAVLVHHVKKVNEETRSDSSFWNIDGALRGSGALSGGYDLHLGIIKPDIRKPGVLWFVRSKDGSDLEFKAKWDIIGPKPGPWDVELHLANPHMDAQQKTAGMDLYPKLKAEIPYDRATLLEICRKDEKMLDDALAYLVKQNLIVQTPEGWIKESA